MLTVILDIVVSLGVILPIELHRGENENVYRKVQKSSEYELAT